MRRRGAWASALLVMGALAAAGPAAADISGPDDGIAQAFGPLQPATDYFGAFRSPGDVDYASFVIDREGESLHFDVENTLAPCTSPFMNGCPMYATLLDGSARQLGGDGSSAGTGPVDAGTTDIIDWTFASTGTYYVVFDSDGDKPTYRVRYTVLPAAAPGGGSSPGAGTPVGSAPAPSPTPTGGGGSQVGAGPGAGNGSPTGAGAAVSRLVLRSPQRSNRVIASVRIGQPLPELRVKLTPASGGPALGASRSFDVDPGKRTLRVALRRGAAKRLASRGSLRLLLKLVAVPEAGAPVTLAHRVTLLAPRH